MTPAAKRWGDSLYELARTEGLEERILGELDMAAACIADEPDYLRLLSTIAVPKKERCALLQKAFEGAHPYVINFLSLLCENGFLAELSGCIRAYRDLYNLDHGIAEATVTSALPLSDDERERLVRKLAAMTGKTVVLNEKTDPAVVGGLRVTIGGKRLDGTVRRRLDKLREDMQNEII